MRVACETCDGTGELDNGPCEACGGDGVQVVDPFDTNEEARGER